MPSIQVTGQLVDPTTGVEGSAEIKITSLLNYGKTTKKSNSTVLTDASGNYDFQLVEGKHMFHVKYSGEYVFTNMGTAIVGEGSPNPINLIQLINLSDENPPSELVTELQQLREDTINDIINTSAQVLENAGYQGEWVSGTSTALKGETWQVSGRYYVALKNTSVDPINDNDNWREDVTTDYVTTAQNDIVGGSIFKGSNGKYVQNGDVVDPGITHLRVLVGGEPSIVEIHPVASGVVSSLTDASAIIDGSMVKLYSKNNPVKFSDIYNGWLDNASLYGGSLPSSEYNGQMPTPYPISEYLKVYKINKDYSYSFNRRSFLGSVSITLYVSSSGSDSITAGSLYNPITWTGVQAKSDNGDFAAASLVRLYLLDDIYYRTDAIVDFSATFPSSKLEIESIAPSGFSYLTTASGSQVWTAYDVNTWQTSTTISYSSVFNTKEVDSLGMPVMYEEKNDVASLTPGSWFYDSVADIMYVRPFQNVSGIQNSIIITPETSLRFQIEDVSNRALFKNIFWACNACSVRPTTKSNPTIMQNCRFVAGKSDSMSYNSDTGFVILLDCIGAWSGKDVFNYHAYNMASANDSLAMEVNCIAYNAGLYKYTGGNVTTNSNNGSTAHDGMTVFRYGSKYWNCEGPVLADVGGCYSVNYGIDSGDVIESTTGDKTPFLFNNFNKTVGPDFVVLVDSYAHGDNTELSYLFDVDRLLIDNVNGENLNTSFSVATLEKF